jgi:Galactose oxidase, central domain
VDAVHDRSPRHEELRMAKVLWTQKQDVGPSARGEHAIAYDATRQRVLLFGGRAGGATPQGDTWEWDGRNWTQVADTGPDPRAGHALVFDANRRRAVLFGGEAGESALRGDTWEWDGENWTQVADTGPDARLGHALAFDTNRQRALLFGGEAGSGLRADTWEWDGEDWTQVADTGPDARRGHGLAFDTNRQRAVLFGGETASGLRADTWEWDGAHWTQKGDTGPGPSLASAMTFGAGATLLFGGVTDSPAPIAVTALSPAPAAVETLWGLSWEWDGVQWTLRQDMGPAPRWGHALAFDSARDRAVLFGGFAALPADPGVVDSVLADTWEASIEEIPVDGPDPSVGGYPALVSFALNPDTLPGSGVVSIRVGLDRPAPSGGVQVEILGAVVGVPPVFVAEGQTTGLQTLNLASNTPAGDYEMEARLTDVIKTAVLHVPPGSWPAPGVTLLQFDLHPETVTADANVPFGIGVAFYQPVALEVVLDGPAPHGGVQVGISLGQVMGDPVVVAEGETIGRHQLTATTATASQPMAWVLALRIGENEIQARLGDVTLTKVLRIVRPPPT